MSLVMLPAHPLADLLPKMTDIDLAELVADIAEHGQRDAAVTWVDPSGTEWLLDGRHRAHAARELGRPLVTKRFAGDESAARDFVISVNVKRRHLSVSQRALVAAAFATRQRGGSSGSSGPASSPLAPTQREAALSMGVSERSVRDGSVVLAEGRDDLIRAVANGEMSVSAAAAESRRERTPRQAATALFMNHRRSSSSDAWLTPDWVLERAERCLGGIDGDVAAAPDGNVPAKWFLTEKDDAMAQPTWANPDGSPASLWVNPPYGLNGRGPGAWTSRVVHEWRVGHVRAALLLLPSRPGAHWQQALAPFPRIEFRGHLRFEPGRGNPARDAWDSGKRAEAPFASILVGIGVSAAELHEYFGDTGIVFIAYQPGIKESASGR
ncbi:DNA N-6-adenine-methyltransferase [Microbacterium hydrocarbonoxydans]|uniref:DNA N-6-adenine-methyltransferase n=1 Tax=Microbacterium hydrocarbonoxydans TaxID=273678 RepID=UPI0020400D28|nr:DNA N-6-adenine-methyltransferase [Microbacterium hydrocarbonoxydans]MCM3778806.1 hypothetical protein [Microbacterium hydrocarbonoxydans]